MFVSLTAFNTASKQTKQYGILVADKKGRYTLKDFHNDKYGKVETTSKGNIMIPLKKVSASYGFKFSYNKKTKKATVSSTYSKKKLVFTLNSKNFSYYAGSKAKAVKKQTAFRLNENLVNRLKAEARRTNRSLSNYVECILMESVYNEPNDETKEAIKEAKSGKYAGTIDMENFESFMKSVIHFD